MTIRRILTVFLMAGVLSSVSCASQDTASEPDAAGFEKAYAAAEAAKKMAASVDGEWRDTGKILKSAKAAANKGDYEKAIQLANKARKQGELGYQQALDQKNAGMPSYLGK